MKLRGIVNIITILWGTCRRALAKPRSVAIKR